MAELFADLPEALENTVEIARRCNLALSLGETSCRTTRCRPGRPPRITCARSRARGSTRGSPHRPARPAGAAIGHADYDSRLATELDVICQMGFAGYFLIVADFIRWAREHDMPVGPGRGSGAGSLVAWALGITDLDPLHHDLLFERFLNPERVSMPDFDIDFCMEGRDRVIDYVADRYGRERVSQIITYGTMAAKAVVRDVGARARACRYGFVDGIAKLIPVRARHHARQRAREGGGAAQALQDEDERAQRHRSRALARGPGAQRRHACRRRRDRAVGAHRVHAALPRRGRTTASSPSSTRTTSRPRASSSSTSWACAR